MTIDQYNKHTKEALNKRNCFQLLRASEIQARNNKTIIQAEKLSNAMKQGIIPHNFENLKHGSFFK